MDAVELPAETITSEVMKKCATQIGEDHDDKFGVPSLEELGEFLCVCVCTGQQIQTLSSVSHCQVYTSGLCFPGFETEGLSTAVWPGGETEALMRLERHLERKVRKRFTTHYRNGKYLERVST